MIHCGYYDPEIANGIYEFHVNYFVVAEDISEAKKKIKINPYYQYKKMHIDGIEEVEAVEGYSVQLSYNPDLQNRTITKNYKHRDLAPSPSPNLS